MKKYLLIVAALAFGASSVAYAYAPVCGGGECTVHRTPVSFEQRWQFAQATTSPTTTVQTNAPVTATTTVSGGDLAAQIIEWLQVAFGTIIAGLFSLLVVRIRAYFGLLTTDAQKAALQAIAVNGVNQAALKAETALKDNPNLKIDVKNAVVQDAITYTQSHGAEIIKALGLDPSSGDAVDAVKARVATAMNSSETPTVTSTTVTPAVHA